MSPGVTSRSRWSPGRNEERNDRPYARCPTSFLDLPILRGSWTCKGRWKASKYLKPASTCLPWDDMKIFEKGQRLMGYKNYAAWWPRLWQPIVLLFTHRLRERSRMKTRALIWKCEIDFYVIKHIIERSVVTAKQL